MKKYACELAKVIFINFLYDSSKQKQMDNHDKRG